MNEKIKIYHFVSGLVDGGAQKQMLMLLENIDYNQCQNFVIYVKAPVNFDFESYPGVKFISVNNFYFPGTYGNLNSIFHIWMPDVFTYINPFNFFKFRKRVVIGVRNKYNFDSIKRVYQLFCFLLFKNFVSNTPFSIHKKIHQWVYKKDNYTYIPNCIRYKIEEDNFDFKKKNFLYVGRLVEHKGVRELIKVFFKGTNEILNVVGEGSLREELELSTQKQAHIKFYGYVNEPKSFFLEHKFLILPSYYEGMPNVAFEALSNNCMLLLSSIPQNKAWFDNDEVIYFEPKSVRSLREAIEKAKKMSKEERELKVLKAKKVLKKLTIERYVSEYTKFYKKILDGSL